MKRIGFMNFFDIPWSYSIEITALTQRIFNISDEEAMKIIAIGYKKGAFTLEELTKAMICFEGLPEQVVVPFSVFIDIMVDTSKQGFNVADNSQILRDTILKNLTHD